MKKAIKIWLFLAICLTLCLSFVTVASAEATVCQGNHTYENECDKSCSVCGNIRIAPHKNEDGNDLCDLCELTLCEHTDTPVLIDSATCEKPRTCRICGETDGTALGHYWAAATCTAPKICSTCGKSDNTPLGHKWSVSNCTTAPVCSVCNKTGTVAGHQYDNTCDTDCNVCLEARTVVHVDLNEDSYCDLCAQVMPSDGLNGGEITVIILLPVLSIAAGVGIYFLLTHLKKKKAAEASKDEAPKDEAPKDEAPKE